MTSAEYEALSWRLLRAAEESDDPDEADDYLALAKAANTDAKRVRREEEEERAARRAHAAEQARRVAEREAREEERRARARREAERAAADRRRREEDEARTLRRQVREREERRRQAKQEERAAAERRKREEERLAAVRREREQEERRLEELRAAVAAVAAATASPETTLLTDASPHGSFATEGTWLGGGASPSTAKPADGPDDQHADLYDLLAASVARDAERAKDPPPYTGSDLAAHRKRFGLTQRILAAQMGVAQSTVAKAELLPDEPLGPALQAALQNVLRYEPSGSHSTDIQGETPPSGYSASSKSADTTG